ncbi:MAG: CHAT domain-containing protein, partial [Desulfobacterales bacterium]|nr:CHAT domain-containing protein [Desulfobacterales bacterium]
MTTTLHISLKPVKADAAELRCYRNNPNDYTRRSLKLADIEDLIANIEAGYYTLLPEDFARTGQRLFQWLDGADRFLAGAMEKQKAAHTLALAIETEGKLAHLPWEVLHDGDSFLVQRQHPLIVPVRWQNRETGAVQPANRPLRVLFMATSPMNVEPVLNYEQEEGLILDATERQPLSLTVEESGDLAELENLVASYESGWFDVFHLTGHANLKDGQGWFFTETETGEAHAAPAGEIAQALVRMPRLVFLSGCR